MMATAVAPCLPTAPVTGDVITIYAPTSRAAADARAILPFDVVVVAAPAWSVARAALGASSCLVLRTSPPSPPAGTTRDGPIAGVTHAATHSDALALLADVRRAHPSLAVVFQSSDDCARAAAKAGLAHEAFAWGDTRSTLWSRVQSALTGVMLETAARRARTASQLAPPARTWLTRLWSPSAAPLARTLAEACDAARVTPETLSLAWPRHAPSPESLVVWTLLLRTAASTARGESWRAAAEAAGMDPRALRHALAQTARLRAGELAAPVVPAADNPHARLRRAFRRRVADQLVGPLG